MEGIWCLERAWNNTRLLNLVQKQNIKQYLWQLLNWLGWNLYVIVKLLFILHQNGFFMRGLNISRVRDRLSHRKDTLRIPCYRIWKTNQLAHVFTKLLSDHRISYICNKLGTTDLYALAWKGVLHILYTHLRCIILYLILASYIRKTYKKDSAYELSWQILIIFSLMSLFLTRIPHTNCLWCSIMDTGPQFTWKSMETPNWHTNIQSF